MLKIEWKQPSGELIRIPDGLKPTLARIRGQTSWIRITIEPVYMERTADQNAFFHAKLGELSELCGGSKNWLKDEVKMFATKRGYPYEVVNGEIVPKSVKQASVEEMEILIDSLYEYATKNGHVLQGEIRC